MKGRFGKLYDPAAVEKTRVKDAGPDRVRNEPWEWYDKCITRNRNTGKKLVLRKTFSLNVAKVNLNFMQYRVQKRNHLICTNMHLS